MLELQQNSEILIKTPNIGFDDPKVGQGVEEKGKPNGGGAFEALEISLDICTKAPVDEARIEGVIESIDLEKNALRLANCEFVLPDSIEITGLQHHIVDLKGLKVGQRVKLKGKYSGWKEFVLEKIKAKKTPKQQIEVLSKIIGLVRTQKFSSEAERIDYVRNFVYTSSIHQTDEEHNEYAGDIPRVLSMIYDYHVNKTYAPHLSCGPRAKAMQAILDELNITSRLVHIFSDDYNHVQSHTFLEVFNTDTKQWEIQDPDYNIHYVNIRTLTRYSTIQLVLGSLEEVMPCFFDSSCGWLKNDEVNDLRERFFKAVMYDNRKDGRKSVIIVNINRFLVSKKFSENEGLDFIQFANKYYMEPIFILNQGLK